MTASPPPEAPADVAAQAYRALYDWAEREGFEGYDPYDGCNTRHGLLLKARPVRLALTYANKFSPVNVRPLLGIPKIRNVQGLALIVSAVLRRPPRAGFDAVAFADRHLAYIRSQSLVDRYGYHCWNGNGIAIQTRREFQTPTMPGIVGTANCGHAALALLEHRPDRDDLREMARSVRDFFLDELYEAGGGAPFFRYKPHDPARDCFYNASILAAGYVEAANAALGEDRGAAEAEAAIRFVVERQHGDGHWAYYLNVETGQEQLQTDYHQGFILDELLDHLERDGGAPGVREAYVRGLRFFREAQYTDDGLGLYRLPKTWPANIHNQAQGIITFARAAPIDPDYAAFARTVLQWTMDHMRDPEGYFYSFKYPLLTNRIPYLRWGQAWMMNALSRLLVAQADGPGRPPSSSS